MRNETDNIERCAGLSCEANYQCYSNICSRDLICSELQSESRFNGIIALLGFLLSLVGITAIGIQKLCCNRITRESLRERLTGVINKKQADAKNGASAHNTSGSKKNRQSK